MLKIRYYCYLHFTYGTAGTNEWNSGKKEMTVHYSRLGRLSKGKLDNPDPEATHIVLLWLLYLW